MENSERRSKWPLEKEIARLMSGLKFTVSLRRIVILGLLLTTSGIVLKPFTLVPQVPLRWAVIILIAAGLGGEVFWKCFSSYCVGAARAGWMKRRSLLVDACGKIAISAVHLRESTSGQTGCWVPRIIEAAASLSTLTQSIIESVEDLDDVVERLEDLSRSGPFLAATGAETLSWLPKIWERFSFILPDKARRQAFDPAFNDVLEKYMRAKRFLGKNGRRWLALAFTMWSIFIVLDCIRVVLTSGVLPESLRAWWRRY